MSLTAQNHPIQKARATASFQCATIGGRRLKRDCLHLFRGKSRVSGICEPVDTG